MWNPNFIVYNTNLRLGGIKFKVHVSSDGLREWSEAVKERENIEQWYL